MITYDDLPCTPSTLRWFDTEEVAMVVDERFVAARPGPELRWGNVFVSHVTHASVVRLTGLVPIEGRDREFVLAVAAEGTPGADLDALVGSLSVWAGAVVALVALGGVDPAADSSALWQVADGGHVRSMLSELGVRAFDDSISTS